MIIPILFSIVAHYLSLVLSGFSLSLSFLMFDYSIFHGTNVGSISMHVKIYIMLDLRLLGHYLLKYSNVASLLPPLMSYEYASELVP